jgi:hypothetical protein
MPGSPPGCTVRRHPSVRQQQLLGAQPLSQPPKPNPPQQKSRMSMMMSQVQLPFPKKLLHMNCSSNII